MVGLPEDTKQGVKVYNPRGLKGDKAGGNEEMRDTESDDYRK